MHCAWYCEEKKTFSRATALVKKVISTRQGEINKHCKKMVRDVVEKLIPRQSKIAFHAHVSAPSSISIGHSDDRYDH